MCVGGQRDESMRGWEQEAASSHRCSVLWSRLNVEQPLRQGVPDYIPLIEGDDLYPLFGEY